MSIDHETIELVWIPILLALLKLVTVAKAILVSLWDLKRELYENEVLPDRGKKGERF